MTGQSPAQVALIKIRDHARVALAVSSNKNPGVHWTGCWAAHPDCLLFMLAYIAEQALDEEGVPR